MKYLYFTLTILVIVASLGLSKAQEPTIDPVDTAVEKYGYSSTLQCNVDFLGSYQPMQWFREGERLSADGEKYEMNSLNNTLTIIRVLPEDVGEYTCRVRLHNGQAFNETVNLYSMPYVHHFDKSKNLVQGDPLVLECEAEGNPEPTLSWLKDGEPLDTSDERLTLSENADGLANGTLRLEDLQFEDRAEYTCVATNEYGTSNSTILVRVKDKLAALWPFLGICAEVAILVIIIFVYENRRSKKLEELDAREEADHLTNSHAHKGGDEVRQRK